MLKAGTFLGNRYEIVSRIGSGGMSDVYKATDLKLNRFVAIKVLKSEFSGESSFVGKFRMEAQSAAGLSHPNIVNVYDVGEDRGVHYIVMELIEGITLKKYIERKKKLEIRESIEVAMQVARGIEAAHQQHIIHRDIKPQNIMISRDGKVKVTDFGIARASSSQTISSNTMGSVHYISPEQARGGYCDERSDIYSLGITLYEMLTGRVPFEGDSTVSVALLHIQGDMVPPRQYEPLIPVSLEKIILKCTQKKPELRYASATELIADLKKSLTMPNEDFVKIASLKSDSPTVIFSGDDREEINRRRGASYPEEDRRRYDDEYDRDSRYDDERYEDDRYDDGRYDDDDRYDRDRRYRDDDRRRYDDDYDDYEDDRNRHSRMEKIVTAISIFVALIIVMVIAIFVMKGCGSELPLAESSSSAAETTTTAAETSSKATVEMQNLLGMTEANATRLLSQLGLVANVVTEPSEDYAEGLVFEQEYKEGEVLEVGKTVTIKVSAGSEAVEIPNTLKGMSVSDARSTLRGLGFTVAEETRSENSDNVEEGYVIGTDPAMGTAAKKGAVITLIISKGPAVKKVTVPDITGMTESRAISRLEERSLKTGRVTYESSEDVAEGLVISQDPASGKEVEENTSVSFVVSSGSGQVTVPDLTYSTLAQAKQALAAAGLSLGSVSEEYSDESDNGLVIGQSVAKDTKVDKGTSIDLVVGKGPEPTTEAAPELPSQYEDGGDPDDYEEYFKGIQD